MGDQLNQSRPFKIIKISILAKLNKQKKREVTNNSRYQTKLSELGGKEPHLAWTHGFDPWSKEDPMSQQ